MKAIAVLIFAGGLAGCGLHGNDEFANYVQRKDTLTLGAGDAQRQNMATHVLNPWPPGVTDRRIPTSGARAAKAIECYEGGDAAKKPVTTSQTNVTVGGGGASGQTNSSTSSKC